MFAILNDDGFDYGEITGFSLIFKYGLSSVLFTVAEFWFQVLSVCSSVANSVVAGLLCALLYRQADKDGSCR